MLGLPWLLSLRISTSISTPYCEITNRWFFAWTSRALWLRDLFEVSCGNFLSTGFVSGKKGGNDGIIGFNIKLQPSWQHVVVSARMNFWSQKLMKKIGKHQHLGIFNHFGKVSHQYTRLNLIERFNVQLEFRIRAGAWKKRSSRPGRISPFQSPNSDHYHTSIDIILLISDLIYF